MEFPLLKNETKTRYLGGISQDFFFMQRAYVVLHCNLAIQNFLVLIKSSEI